MAAASLSVSATRVLQQEAQKEAGIPSNVQLDYQTQVMIEQTKAQQEARKALDAQALPVKVPVVSFLTGEETGETIDLDPRVFHAPLRPDIIHRVVVWQQKNKRTTLYKAKDRSEVSGGGKKPWKQKGTGRARHGSTRSPIWVGGGAAHGPVLRDWSVRLNKKIRRMGLRVAISAKLRDARLVVVDDLRLDASAETAAPAAENAENLPVLVPKTKTLSGLLAKLGVSRAEYAPVVIVGGEELPDAVARAAKNLKDIKSFHADGANVYDIVHAEKLILSRDAVKLLTYRLTQDL